MSKDTASNPIVSLNQGADIAKILALKTIADVIGTSKAADCDARCGCVGGDCSCNGGVWMTDDSSLVNEFSKSRDAKIAELRQKLKLLESRK